MRARIGRRHGIVRSIFVAGAGILAMSFVTVATGLAQDAPRLLNIGVSTGLTTNSNRELDPNTSEGTTAATVGLSFDYVDATPIQSLTLSGSTGLRFARGSEAVEEDNGLTDPTFRFAYQRSVPDTAFSLSGSVRRSDVSFLRSLDDFLLDPDDPLFDPDQLTSIQEDGTRLTFDLGTRVDLFRRARFGVDLSAGLSGTRYSGTTDPDLVDTDRTRAGVGLRFEIDPVTRARLGLRRSRIQEDDPTVRDRDTTQISASIARDFPLGVIGLDATTTQTDGTIGSTRRNGLELSLSRRSTTWDLSGRIGLSRNDNGETTAIGGLTATRELENSQIGISFDRSVRTGDTSNVTVTALSVDYGTRLTPVLSLSAGASYVQTDEPTEPTAEAGTLNLNLNRALTEDWALSAGVTQRYRSNSNGTANDTAVSLGIRRSFQFIP